MNRRILKKLLAGYVLLVLVNCIALYIVKHHAARPGLSTAPFISNAGGWTRTNNVYGDPLTYTETVIDDDGGRTYQVQAPAPWQCSHMSTHDSDTAAFVMVCVVPKKVAHAE